MKGLVKNILVLFWTGECVKVLRKGCKIAMFILPLPLLTISLLYRPPNHSPPQPHFIPLHTTSPSDWSPHPSPYNTNVRTMIFWWKYWGSQRRLRWKHFVFRGDWGNIFGLFLILTMVPCWYIMSGSLISYKKQVVGQTSMPM